MKKLEILQERINNAETPEERSKLKEELSGLILRHKHLKEHELSLEAEKTALVLDSNI